MTFKIKLKKMLAALTYERKFFVRLVCLVAIPVIIMGVITYNIYLYEESARRSTELNSYSMKIAGEYEDIFSSVKQYYLQLASEDDVRWMVWQDSPPYDQYTRMKRIQEDMQANYFKNQYIENYEFINVQMRWVMNRYGVFPFSSLRNEEETNQFLDDQEQVPLNAYWLQNSDTQDNSANATNFKTVDTNGMRLIIKNSMGTGKVSWMISVRLNTLLLNKIADSYRDLGYSVTVLDGDTIIGGNDQELAQAYINRTDPDSSRLKTANGGHYDINIRTGDVSGFTYVIGYDFSQVRQSGQVFLIAALLVIVAAFALLAVIHMMSLAFAAPLHHLEDFLNEGEVRIQQLLLENLLKGELDAEKINDGLEKSAITPFASYRALSLICKGTGEEAGQQEELYQKICRQLPEEITQLVFITPLLYRNSLVFLVGGKDDRSAENKMALLYTLLKDHIQKTWKYPIACGISQPFHKLQHAKRAYNECREALYDETNRSNEEKSSLVLYDDYSMAHQDRNVYDKIMEESLIKAIEHQDLEESRRLLEELIQRMYVQRGKGIERNFYLTSLLTTIVHIPVTHGIQLSDVFQEEDDVLGHILQIYDTRRLVDEISESLLIPVIRSIQQQDGQGQESEIIPRITAMIKESKGNITLNECAQQLNYHPNYLSKVLKKEKGMTFTDMVNEEKMMQIKYLLLTTDISVAEIAERLNYTNVQNMIRFFKKNTEQTPAVFRKEHRTAK